MMEKIDIRNVVKVGIFLLARKEKRKRCKKRKRNMWKGSGGKKDNISKGWSYSSKSKKEYD